MSSLASVTSRMWDGICKKIGESATVFLDSSAAECLHWTGGFVNLLTQEKAIEVKEFSSFESGHKRAKKGIFILTSPIVGVTESILATILKNSHFTHCQILTCVHPSVQCFAMYENDETVVYQHIKEKMLNWMGNRSFTVEFDWQHVFVASICSSLFVTPPFSQMFPFHLNNSTSNEKGLSRKSLDLEAGDLPNELLAELKNFVHCFNNLLDELNVREDCFTVGQFSKFVASLLDNLPTARNRRKVATGKATVLFIDRTLDLVGPTGHGVDTLMDRINSMLPKLPNHSTDVAVDMHSLCSVQKMTSNDNILVAPGCLGESFDPVSSSILNSLIVNKHKECLMELNRQLVDAVTKEKLLSSGPMKAGRLNAETLENNVKLFKNKTEAIYRHCGLLQQALAVIQTLKHSGNSHMDQLYGIEKGLLHTLGEEIQGTNAISQIIQLIKSRKERSITVEDITIFLVYIYSLIGEDFSIMSEDMESLQVALIEAINEDKDELSEILTTFLEGEIDIKSAVHTFFDRLCEISSLRRDLKKYRVLFEPGGRAQPACYHPLLRQILDDTFNPSRPELTDVEYKSAGLRDMIKTGFSLFMNVNKPHPCDSPFFIIFIIGGITSSEVRLIRETVAARKSTSTILVGSTRLVKPNEILDQLLNPRY